MYKRQYKATGIFAPVLGVESPYSELVRNVRLRVRSILYGSGLVIADVYFKILRSRRIQTEVIKKCNLMDVYKKKYIEDALKEFERNTNIEVGWEGFVTVTAKAHKAELAAKIVNEWMMALDKYLREVQMLRGVREKTFIQRRLHEIETKLRMYKDSLNVFLTKHGLIEQSSDTLPDIYTLNTQISEALDLYHQLNADLVRKEALLSYYSSLGDSLPITRRLRTKVLMLKKNLREFFLEEKRGIGPGFGEPLILTSAIQSRYRDLRRNVDLYTNLYNLLLNYQEIARLEETKDMPAIEIIDWATPPQRREWPRRAIIVLVAMGSSFLISILICLSERHEEFL